MLLFYTFILYQQLYIDHPSIVLFNYKLNSNNLNTTSMLINNIKYRETSIPNNFNGITALELKPGEYNLKMNHNNTNLQWLIFTDYEKIMQSQHNLNDIIINNSTLVSYKYYSNNNHILHLAYQIVLPKQNSTIQFTLNIDGNEFNTESNNGFSIYKNISLLKGYHNIKIISKSSSNWCSCPSYKNGFYNGRYFYAWINKINENPITINNKYSTYATYSFNLIYLIHLLII